MPILPGMSPSEHLLDLGPEQLASSLGELGEPAYRGRQILTWAIARSRLVSALRMTGASRPS